MPNHYRIALRLTPQRGELQATVELTCLVPAGAEALTFILHRSLTPASVTGDGVSDHVWTDGQTLSPFITEGNTLTVRFGEPAAATTRRRLTFVYGGCPGVMTNWQTNRVTAEWVELGLYAPWFPYQPDEQFTYEVAVTAEGGYAVLGSVPVAHGSERWLLRSDAPVSDITILAAPTFTAVPAQGVTAHVVDAHDAAYAAELVALASAAISHLTARLGPLTDGRPPAMVVVPRTYGGAYVRPGLVVMSRPAGDAPPDRRRLFRWVAHECAHAWFFRAPTATWEDWLNESFAEYSAVTALGAEFGPEAAADYLSGLRGRSENLPPLTGLPRQHEKAHDVLYAKGAVILADLAIAIGEATMTTLLQELLRRRITATGDLLALLAELAGPAAAASLNTNLNA